MRVVPAVLRRLPRDSSLRFVGGRGTLPCGAAAAGGRIDPPRTIPAAPPAATRRRRKDSRAQVSLAAQPRALAVQHQSGTWAVVLALLRTPPACKIIRNRVSSVRARRWTRRETARPEGDGRASSPTETASLGDPDTGLDLSGEIPAPRSRRKSWSSGPRRPWRRRLPRLPPLSDCQTSFVETNFSLRAVSLIVKTAMVQITCN